MVGPTKGGHSAVRLTVKDQKQPEDGWCSQLPRSMAEHVAVNPRQSECNSHWCTCHSISSDLWLTYVHTYVHMYTVQTPLTADHAGQYILHTVNFTTCVATLDGTVP